MLLTKIEAEDIKALPVCMRMFANEFLLAGGRIELPLPEYFRFRINEVQAGLDMYNGKWAVSPNQGDSSDYLDWQEAELILKRCLGLLTR